MKFYAVFVFLLIALTPSFQTGTSEGTENIPIAGGLSDVPIDDPEVVRLSNFALGKINEHKLGATQRELVEIVKASRQTVAGSLTHLTLRISEGEAKKLCEVKVLEQAWLNKTELIYSSCDGVVEFDKKD